MGVDGREAVCLFGLFYSVILPRTVSLSVCLAVETVLSSNLPENRLRSAVFNVQFRCLIQGNKGEKKAAEHACSTKDKTVTENLCSKAFNQWYLYSYYCKPID